MVLDTLKRIAVPGESLEGLQRIEKAFAKDGSSAFLTLSDLDLDTDGAPDPDINYESTHQDETSADPGGDWLNSNDIQFVVLPGGFEKRHGGVKIGCLCTVFHKGRHAHAIYADVGPRKKYGEGSIALHRALGYERLKDAPPAVVKRTRKRKKIIDVGIDSGVRILIYIGSRVSQMPCDQARIDFEAEQLFARFNS